jgi:Sulfotransferase family
MILEDLNKKRTEEYIKDQTTETFLKKFNSLLKSAEQDYYQDSKIKAPILFTFGLPRSGTTLISQFISSFFELGYINNISSRFFEAPILGIKFSKSIFPKKLKSELNNAYAKTSVLTDIHEFGYFWKTWLKKNSLKEIANFREIEKEIDWQGLKRCIAAIQQEFDDGLIFKSIYSSYHMPKFINVLDGKALFVYIERDELDVAISILEGRKKYYGDKLNEWWSYAPPEVLELLKLPYKKQIAGQIYYLKKFYQDEFFKINQKHIFRISYVELSEQPQKIADSLQKHLLEHFNYDLKPSFPIPEKLNYSTHQNDSLKKEFEILINEFRNNDTPL